jgi:Family of unknown function (DUF5681)
MAANAAPKQRRRGRGRPFPVGQSGNPKGKAPGTRHHITRLAERLMEDDVEAVVAKVVRAAKGGDMAAARLILDRVAPPRRGRAVEIALPDVNTPGGVTIALAAVIKAMADGMISTDEAAAVAAVIETQRRAIETEQLQERLLAIEEQLKPNEHEN